MSSRREGLAAAVAAASPWTWTGLPDPDVDEAARQAHRALLTDPSLLTCFRRRFPAQREADYDEMVRLLGWVWDCPWDGAANVTGYCCARCGQTRAAACAPETTARSAAG
jgi:hypothetical protein